jgi:flagellar basal-body rod modification protein FlgD
MTTITSPSSDLALPKPQTTNSNATMDQASFLKLLTTQMTTQDPFKPVDNTQMVAQMAQFSSVAGIAEMNASLKNLTEQLTGGRITDLSGWIGRDALVESETVPPRRDGSYAGEIALPEAAQAVSVSLVDANGQVVHTQNFGAQPAGTVSFNYANEGGATTGPLKIVVNAIGAKGQIDTVPGAWVPVTAVHSPASGADMRLVTPIGLVAPDQAVRLS